MGIGDKLNSLLLENDSNPNKLSEETGISPSTIYSIIKRNNTKVDLSVLQIISDKFGVSLEYFADRDSDDLLKPDFEASQSEKELIKKYRLIDDYAKKAIESVLNIEYERYERAKAAKEKKLAEENAKKQAAIAKKEEIQKAAFQAAAMRKLPDNVVMLDDYDEEPEDTITLPLYDTGASAGTGVFLDSPDYEMIALPDDYTTRRANFAVWVTGDSMEPRFSNGDLVLVRTQPAIDIGDIGIFILNGEGYIKKLGKNKLISLNPAYSDIKIGEDDSIYVKGKVLGKA